MPKNSIDLKQEASHGFKIISWQKFHGDVEREKNSDTNPNAYGF
jgi:hypothetical protein